MHRIGRWRNKIETFPALLALCAGNSPVTGEFPGQRPVPRNFDVFFDLRLNKRLCKIVRLVNLRRHRSHYDVTVMFFRNAVTARCQRSALAGCTAVFRATTTHDFSCAVRVPYSTRKKVDCVVVPHRPTILRPTTVLKEWLSRRGNIQRCYLTVAIRCLISVTTRLFVQYLIQDNNEKGIKLQRHCLFVPGFPTQRASEVERASMSWRHNVSSKYSSHMYELSQWEEALLCNAISHWLSPYRERSCGFKAWFMFCWRKYNGPCYNDTALLKFKDYGFRSFAAVPVHVCYSRY